MISYNPPFVGAEFKQFTKKEQEAIIQIQNIKKIISPEQKIKELESMLGGLLSGVLDLKKQISDLGIDEIVDWDEYFAKQKQSLMDAIEQMEKELQDDNNNEDNISYDDNNNEDDIPF